MRSGGTEDEMLPPGAIVDLEPTDEEEAAARKLIGTTEMEGIRSVPTPKTLQPPVDPSGRPAAGVTVDPPVELQGRHTPSPVARGISPLFGAAGTKTHSGLDEDATVSDGIVRRKTGTIKRRISDPAVSNFFDGRDASMSMHLRHDHETRQVLRRMSGMLEVEDVMEGVISQVDYRNFAEGDTGRLYGHLRRYQQVENERLMLKMAGSMILPPTTEAWKAGDITGNAPPGHRTSSKDSRESRRKSSKSSRNSKDHLRVPKEHMDPTDWFWAAVIGFLSVSLVIIMCVWAQKGLFGADDHMGHHIAANTRQGHIHSAIYRTPAVINLQGTQTEFFEVRLVAMATKDFAASHDELHRRLSGRRQRKPRLLLASSAASSSAVTGKITYKLYKCNRMFHERTVELLENEELEHFEDVDVAKALKGDAEEDEPGLGLEDCKDEFFANVSSQRSDDQESAFMLQVVRMSSSGRHRQVIGIVIFVITFISIVSEKIHRSYSAFLGASCTLCSLSAIQETPHLHTIMGMVDWGTLMLLFSMMILMQMLAVTGFFNWFALKVVVMSKQNEKVLFFALTNICGVLSMVLDNVTCVMLFGPLTYSLCKKMGLNPRPLYLSMTICATVGGTATFIGDPPNIVIGSKMRIGFEKFLMFNLPIVLVVMLPLCSVILYWRVQKDLRLKGVPQPRLDIDALQHQNRITDLPMFAKLCMVLFAILLSLLLSPIHRIEPAWFTVMGMFACAILFEPHKLAKYLEFVEWDTLLFFALLFVLVESLSELGVIRMLGSWILAFIEVFPENARMAMALVIILWVSSVGSAFLESLPYTTTIVYILIDLQRKTIPGVDPAVLVWPLSVGACVGGIGSIMGSSANLVCMAVANRMSDKEEFKVHGGDFLKYGLPTMLILTFFAMVWQLIIFVALDVKP